MEATESRLTLKVGVLLPNCPEYAVVVLGVSLVYQFFYTTSKLSSPRSAPRALGLLLADGVPIVGLVETFWRETGRTG